MKPILISMPHCSNFVPKEILQLINISEKKIKKHCDLDTDVIFGVPDVHTVKAKISRLVADPNRAPDDIEKEALLANEGVIVHVSEDKEPIYKVEPTFAQIEDRIIKYHHPYHQEIDEKLPHIKFLIDGHSLRSVGPATKKDAGIQRADIVLGNRSFTTCSRKTTLFFKHFFEKIGYSVAINNPYEGKYILGYHCSRKYLPGIQIELNRGLYMNEETLTSRKRDLKRLNEQIKILVNEFYEYMQICENL